ncbi:hypothetical protein ABKN59_010675, partial [Abortiporus biennis]
AISFVTSKPQNPIEASYTPQSRRRLSVTALFVDTSSEVCDGDEAKETEEILNIAVKIGEVPTLLEEVDCNDKRRYTPLIGLIQHVWDGTDYVARNVYGWNEKARPDIACYKKRGDGTTSFDLLSQKDTSVLLNSVPTESSETRADITLIDHPITSNNFKNLPTISEDSAQDSNPSMQTSTVDASTFPPATSGEQIPPEPNPYPPFTAHIDYIGEHAAAIMERQHRTHSFSVVTIGNKVRFLRWDRSSVIVTEPIAFNEDFAKFIKFFYRFARMLPEDQGKDASILEADEKDLKRLYEFQANKVPTLVPNHQECFEDAFVKNKDQFPVVKVHLERILHASHDQPLQHPSDDVLRLLIGAPSTNSYSQFGRCTKGFIAFDLDERRLKCIKDCWRYDENTYHSELEVYKRLREGIKSVPYSQANLAIAEGGGDVVDSHKRVQETVTDSFLNKKWAKVHRKFLSQKHYRFLIRQVGTPLEKYKNSSRSLCSHVLDAMNGHGLAWEEAGVLHRDVSPENILIDEDPEDGNRNSPQSFLHDWDLCKYKEELNDGAAQGIRSGTWPFVSALLLYYPNKQHDLADDLESFVHVIYWFFASMIITSLRTTLLGSYHLFMKTCWILQEHYESLDLTSLKAERARLLGLPPPAVASQTKEEPKEQSLRSRGRFNRYVAHWGLATIPDDENKGKSLDEGKSPDGCNLSNEGKTLSPFLSHKTIMSTFAAVEYPTSYWMISDDKHADQFNEAALHCLFN